MEKKYNYIIAPYGASIEAGIITEDTTRRVNNDRSQVILNPNDLENYKPEIVDGEHTRFATTFEEKVEALGAKAYTKNEILRVINTAEWNNNERN